MPLQFFNLRYSIVGSAYDVCRESILYETIYVIACSKIYFLNICFEIQCKFWYKIKLFVTCKVSCLPAEARSGEASILELIISCRIIQKFQSEWEDMASSFQ